VFQAGYGPAKVYETSGEGIVDVDRELFDNNLNTDIIKMPRVF